MSDAPSTGSEKSQEIFDAPPMPNTDKNTDKNMSSRKLPVKNAKRPELFQWLQEAGVPCDDPDASKKRLWDLIWAVSDQQEEQPLPRRKRQKEKHVAPPAAAPAAAAPAAHPAIDMAALAQQLVPTMTAVLQGLLPQQPAAPPDLRESIREVLREMLPQQTVESEPVTIDITSDTDEALPPPDQKGKRKAVTPETEGEGVMEPEDYDTMPEHLLLPMIRRLGLPEGSRAEMAFNLRRHHAGDSWVDEPIPEIPKEPITPKEGEKIMRRSSNNSIQQYVDYIKRVDRRGLFDSLCDAIRVLQDFMLRGEIMKDGKTYREPAKNTAQLTKALCCLFDNMNEMEIFRLLQNNSRTATAMRTNVRAAKGKEELLMRFQELREQYGLSQYVVNEDKRLKRNAQDPALTERQKAQCVMPIEKMVTDYWVARFKEIWWKVVRRTCPDRAKDQDHLDFMSMCQEWLKFHLGLCFDALRNDLSAILIDEPTHKKGKCWVDRDTGEIVFYGSNKKKTPWVKIKVDRKEAWEMLLAFCEAQRELGRKHVFCNKSRAGGKWLQPQTAQTFGDTFATYFGELFEVEGGRFCYQMFRTLVTCTQNAADNVPLPHEVPVRQAKGKNHTSDEHMSNNYNNRLMLVACDENYAKNRGLVDGEEDVQHQGSDDGQSDGMQADEEEDGGGPSRERSVSDGEDIASL